MAIAAVAIAAPIPVIIIAALPASGPVAMVPASRLGIAVP